MRGWATIIAAAAMSGVLLGGAAADVQKGARAGTASPPSATDQNTSTDDPVEPMSIEG